MVYSDGKDHALRQRLKISFAGVAAVSFFDYNEDGRTDIMILIEYTGGDFGRRYTVDSVYFQLL